MVALDNLCSPRVLPPAARRQTLLRVVTLVRNATGKIFPGFPAVSYEAASMDIMGAVLPVFAEEKTHSEGLEEFWLDCWQPLKTEHGMTVMTILSAVAQTSRPMRRAASSRANGVLAGAAASRGVMGADSNPLVPPAGVLLGCAECGRRRTVHGSSPKHRTMWKQALLDCVRVLHHADWPLDLGEVAELCVETFDRRLVPLASEAEWKELHSLLSACADTRKGQDTVRLLRKAVEGAANRASPSSYGTPSGPSEGEAHACGQCGLPASKRCSRCLAMWYCSVDHQRKHWSAHKAVCKKAVPAQKK